MLKTIFQLYSGEKVWGFGLSAANIKKLQEGQPILFNLSAMGLPPQEVLIFYGATEDIMEIELVAAMTAGTSGMTTFPISRCRREKQDTWEFVEEVNGSYEDAMRRASELQGNRDAEWQYRIWDCRNHNDSNISPPQDGG